MTVERTFIAIKPDGVQRGLTGEIIRRFETKGFTLVGLKFLQPSRELAEQHYAVHKERPFFPGLVDFITSGPVVAMVWEGDGVIAAARKLIGATNPLNAEPGTIRGDLGANIGRNIIHGSDAPETAEYEIGLWFKPEELVNWTPTIMPWVHE
jgi:nucleoside diphosphate kinase (EC 2.7.4.6)